MAKKDDSSSIVFVTVGTTKFDELIKSVDNEDLLQLLSNKGYTDIILQIGKGEYEPIEGFRHGINISVFRLKPSIQDHFNEASLVISHAGAGSCLEALEAKKPLITVINETLMDNHQSELAEHLAESGYSLFCNPRTLYEVLTTFKLSQLKKYIPGNPQLFADYLESVFIIDN